MTTLTEDLRERCRTARELTERMAEALAAGDQSRAEALLGERGEAMAAFEAAHRAADSPAAEACRDDVTALAAADRSLREAASRVLDATAGEFRATLGAAPAQRGSYDRLPSQACVDRQA